MKGRFLFALVLSGILFGCESDLSRCLVDEHPRQTTSTGAASPGKAQSRRRSSNRGPDLASLRVGAPCRIDLIRPAGQGQAYEGTVVRVEDKAVVLSNVISEGPMKHGASLTEVFLEMRPPWSGKTTIDWQRLPDKEFRIAKAEIAAVKTLDHDPILDYSQR